MCLFVCFSFNFECKGVSLSESMHVLKDILLWQRVKLLTKDESAT